MTARLLSILALMAACLMPMGSGAQTSLRIGNVPAYPGATVLVPVTLQQPVGGAVAAQFDLAFNVGKVSAGGAIGTERLANHTMKSREIAPGVRRTLIYSTSNQVIPGTNGILLNQPFTVSSNETVGSGPLTPANVILAESSGLGLSPVSLSAGTIFVRSVIVLPNGHVQFFLAATPGHEFVIQATTNLIHWVNLSTNTAASSFMLLVDVDAANYPYRFYRWELHAP